jgi:hypothetical protein
MVRWRMGIRMILMLVCFSVTVPDQLVFAAEGPQKTEVNWYGYFKLDLAYDSAVSSHGNFVMYVKPYTEGNETETVNITARQSRIGMNVQKGDTFGKVELDFYGGGAENKNLPVLRKAYLDVPLGSFSLLAGQDSDLISSLVPSTLNYTVGWGAGNIGYRRPQLQLHGEREGTSWAVAIARNISEDLNGDSLPDGDASLVPVLQARLARSFGLEDPRVTVGASGHYGLMDSEGASKDDYNTWSLNGEVTIRISPGAKFLGEYYTGANTGSYFGAIANGNTLTEIRSHGGWANLQIKSSGKTAFSLGGGIDDVTNSDDAFSGTANARHSNAFLFGNGVYEVQPGVKLGMEISGWRTKYANATPGTDPTAKDVRLQWTVQGSF